MRKYIYSIILLSGFTVFGQNNFKENYFELNKASANTGNYAEFKGNYQLNSSAVNNDLGSIAVQSGFISPEIKDFNLKRLSSNNSFGFDVGGTFTYKKQQKGFNLTSSVGTHLISNNSFSKDFYKLLLYGNSPYAGENMNLKNTSIYLLAYNKLTLGIEKKIQDKFFVGVSANVYQSLSYRNASVKKGNFYTEPDGRSLNLDLTYEQYSSDANQKSLGLGLDFFAMSKFDKANVFIQVEDFGFIAQKDMTYYHADSNYSFSGIEIENIFDFSTNNYGSGNKDEVHELLEVEKQSKSKNLFLPTKITLGAQQLLSDKWFLEIYGNYRFIQSYIPQLIIKPNYFFSKNFSLAPIFTLGGFGKADVGINASYHHSRFLINLDIQEIENLLLKKQSSGRGMFLRTGFLF